MTLRWSKQMSRTDAQEDTLGYKVPYIRLTKSGSPHNTQTWFRSSFFNGTNWHPGFFGEHPVEQASIEFNVVILGRNVGVRTLMVTHDATRQNNNNAPNTWIHYDDGIRADFEAQNLTGEYIIIERRDDGSYHLHVQENAPNPMHY